MTARVVFWLPAINPYWNDRLNTLAQEGRVPFTCWFNEPVDPGRSWVVDRSTMHYEHEFLPPGTVARLRRIRQLYAGARPTHVLTLHFDPALWPAWIHRIRGRHLSFYCERTWDSWVDRSWPKELAKKLFFSAVSSVLTPGPDADTWVRRYGARRTIRLHHSVRSDRLALAAAQRVRTERIRLLVLGRMIPEKGVDFLMGALDEVMHADPLVDVRFVGDGPLSADLGRWASRWPGRARIDDFVQADHVGELLSGSDLLLFPTTGDPYGLVVDEALAAGVPTISSDHAGEISWRLADGRGWIVPVGDHQAWVRTISRVCSDPRDLQRASSAGLAFSSGHDASRWAREIDHWLSSTCRAPGATR